MGFWTHILKNGRKPIGFTFSRWKSTLTRIDKLLIANRGEIACRVMKTARRLGVRTVAVYSDSDENALHVAMADEAYHIGPSNAAESYLCANKIIEVAKIANCQAIHPGYGFLSENLEFAETCQKNNVIFIGPPASAIRDMGIKSTSKAIMSKAGVPIIEGYHGEDQSIERLKNEAERIGYPIMIKAVRGGGGKGMRIAMNKSEFEEALESARSEAQKAFGDSIVLLERFVGEPRHVEVQVFADAHGNAVHLFERDCSVQRRHQKIIEEAPAPKISNELRMELGSAAVRAAKAVGYVGAGTVEFILDRHSHSFHFMEMNTRLQVEHPITEMITGVDLVEWQIKIASGEKLPVTQDDIKLKGHAFEARIYAENPRDGFLPGAGQIVHLSTPTPGDDVRIETGVREGDEVSVYYDPMIAKLVTWGENRQEALSKLQSNLVQYNVAGLDTNVNFLLELSRHPEFVAGNVHTNFIKDHNDELFKEETATEEQIIQAPLAEIFLDEFEEISDAVAQNDQFNPFLVESRYRPNYDFVRDFKYKYSGKDVLVKVKFLGGSTFRISTDGGKIWKSVKGDLMKEGNKLLLKCFIDGKISQVNIHKNESTIAVFDENGKSEFQMYQPLLTQDEEVDGSSKSVAPMPGVIQKLFVKVGDRVKKGDPLFVIIAMKMEHIVKASKNGKVNSVNFDVGSNVSKGTTVVQFEEELSV